MSKTFTLTSPNCPKEVSAWCSIDNIREDGVIEFTCINGAWSGTFSPTGMTVSIEGGMPSPALKNWEGEVPREYARHYNDAISWIKAQL